MYLTEIVEFFTFLPTDFSKGSGDMDTRWYRRRCPGGAPSPPQPPRPRRFALGSRGGFAFQPLWRGASFSLYKSYKNVIETHFRLSIDAIILRKAMSQVHLGLDYSTRVEDNRIRRYVKRAGNKYSTTILHRLGAIDTRTTRHREPQFWLEQ